MRVLVGCEVSGQVRDAFTVLGHDAMSCDLQGALFGNHHMGDILEVLHDGWDLGVFHPPCTYLATTGNRWFYDSGRATTLTGDARRKATQYAARFFRLLLEAPIPHVAVENPRMNQPATWIVGRGPDQVVHPWQFGDPYVKATCLWLRGLPPLAPTVKEQPPLAELTARSHMIGGKDQAALRSTTYPGIAQAMASQWGRIP